MRRTVMRDGVELRGKRLARGDSVVLVYSSANRDAAVFAETMMSLAAQSAVAAQSASASSLASCKASKISTSPPGYSLTKRAV